MYNTAFLLSLMKPRVFSCGFLFVPDRSEDGKVSLRLRGGCLVAPNAEFSCISFFLSQSKVILYCLINRFAMFVNIEPFVFPIPFESHESFDMYICKIRMGFRNRFLLLWNLKKFSFVGMPSK